MDNKEKSSSHHPTNFQDGFKAVQVFSVDKHVNSALVSLKSGKDTGVGKDCSLAIVPVQIKVSTGNKSISTYAFLDPGSSATFCTKRRWSSDHKEFDKTTERSGKKNRNPT